METLREHRNLVILVVLLVILYLLWNTEVVSNVRHSATNQWATMGTFGKVVLVLVVVALAYYLYNRE